MKVVQVCTLDFGGAGTAARRLNAGLRGLGVDSVMTVLGRKSTDRFVRRFPYDGVGDCLRCLIKPNARSRDLFKRWGRILDGYPDRPAGHDLFTDHVSVYQLPRSREIREADIVHLHWVAGMLDYGNAPEFLSGKRIVWTLHDSNPFTGGCHVPAECGKFRETCGRCPQLGSGDPEDLSHSAWKAKEECYRHLDMVLVAPSRWLGRCAADSSLLGRFPGLVIPNGIPTEVFRPYPKTEAKLSLGLPATGNVILFGAAYVSRWKGFGYLHDAIRRLPARIRGNSVLASFGPLKGIERPEGIRARDFGSVSDQELLARIYSAADVFVIPSLYESLSNTTLESLSCGTPVVGFSQGGVSEIVADGVTGKTAPPGDSGGLAEGIAWILEHSGAMGLPERCRDFAVREYAQHVQAERYRDLYGSLGRLA